MIRKDVVRDALCLRYFAFERWTPIGRGKRATREPKRCHWFVWDKGDVSVPLSNFVERIGAKGKERVRQEFVLLPFTWKQETTVAMGRW